MHYSLENIFCIGMLGLDVSPREFVQDTHSVLVLHQSNIFHDWHGAEHLYNNGQNDISYLSYLEHIIKNKELKKR